MSKPTAMQTRERADQPGILTMPLGAACLKDLPRVGGKAAQLGELIAARLPVPSGFVVTTDACLRFMQSDPRIADWLRSLEKCDPRDPAALRAVAEKVRQQLSAIAMPAAVADAIGAALVLEPGGAWAVRSSATVEDLPEASFAGQHDSFLDVRGADAVVAAVKRCWLSLFSERAISYRMRKGIVLGRAQMAVIVQQLIPADAAGVMFTADPASGDSDSILIEAAFGLGEAVVQGKVTPDRLVVSRLGLQVVRRQISSKRVQIVVGENGVREESLAVKANAPVLDDETAARLAELGLKVERLFGAPQDIEWARHDHELFLLQARPITSKAPVKTWEDRQVWTNVNTGEVMPDVMTPMTWSLIQSLLDVLGSIFRLVGADATRAPLTGLVASRLYFNANTSLAAVRPFSFLHKGLPDFARAAGGDLVEAYRQAPLTLSPEDLPDLGFRWPKYFLSLPRILYDVITHSSRRRGYANLARFKKQTDELDRLDLGAISTPELAQLGTQLIQGIFKDADVLSLATQGAALPVFLKASRDWLGDPGLALRLFAASGGIPVAEAGLALWRLAALAHTDSNTETVVSSENDWPEVRARLDRAEHGRKFLAAWDAFMSEHGHHCRGEFELSNARWCETPDYILGLVRGYLRSLGQSDPPENQRRLAEERKRLIVQCRAQLKNPIKRWIFSGSLRRSQEVTIYREQLKNLGIRRIALARRVLLALGQRLHEQGSLSCRDDIFFLEVSELEPVAADNASFDWRERIESRRREYEKNLKLNPPRVVNGRFDPNAPAWPVASADAKLLEGTPASPGVVTGPARVILRADDHEQVLAGEILVAPFTDPAWSPYFITAAGLVVEQGGILSHGSIVAREYGLPAVTNVRSATKIIRTGQWLEVDADRGLVKVLAAAPDAKS